MSEKYPDRITMETVEKVKVSPDAATLALKVSGESSVFTTEALKKLKDVKSLIDGLKRLGVDESKLSLENIRVTSKSGMFAGASSVTFTLKLQSLAIADVPQTLALAATTKNISLEDIQWEYSYLETRKLEIMKSAARENKKQALELADALGVRLIAVHSLYPKWDEPNRQAMAGLTRSRSLMKARGPGGCDDSEGFELAMNHLDYLEVVIKAEYRVSEFAA
ncbi:SIMPL domain-containing protein [Hahella sp. HN01]|uniref:SIMPL domain-containing protein n=1 Tax=Hahella sp. HN01 TaxID=2847262 RepID=UPI001C1EEC02|nr:SIMPL domain-containing protein [Hahella sp. HN01]MBU6950087.1 SIMPL domain-containing protein [Hahella sp. HN01]